MLIKRTVLIIFSVCLLLSGVYISAAELADNEIKMTAGVSQFEYKGKREESLASGLSARFFELLTEIKYHQIGYDELSVILKKENDKKINDNIIALEKLYLSRDQLIFKSDRELLKLDIIKKEKEIDSKKLEISRLEDENIDLSSRIRLDDALLAEIEVLSPDTGTLFIKQAGVIALTAEKHNLDLLIYGFVETINEYEYVEVRLWDNILKRDTYIWRTALEVEDVTSIINDGLNAFKTVLLGHDWAELSLRAPDNSMIYINGEFTGVGSLNRLLLNPGTVDIEIKKAGSKNHSREVVLESQKVTEIEIELEDSDINTVIIQTWPSGADVYLDSVWTGKSPLRLVPENSTSSVRIVMENYEDRIFFINQETENILNFNLKPASFGRTEFVPESRKRFYTSMGSFILSIPLTALFSSMMDQSASAYNREFAINGSLNREELTRLYNLNRAEYSLYLASAGLNIFLLLDTIKQAVAYVSSVDYFSN